MKDTDNENFQYSFLEGNPKLLSISACCRFDWKKSLPQDEILITNGCMEAINLCLDAVTRPGDIVAIESPCTPGILQCLETKGLKALAIQRGPSDRNQPDELQRAWRPMLSRLVSVCRVPEPHGLFQLKRTRSGW